MQTRSHNLKTQNKWTAFRTRRESAIDDFLKVKKDIWKCKEIVAFIKLRQILKIMEIVGEMAAKKKLLYKCLLFIKVKFGNYWENKVLKKHRNLNRMHRNKIVNWFTLCSLTTETRAYKALEFFLDINS